MDAQTLPDLSSSPLASLPASSAPSLAPAPSSPPASSTASSPPLIVRRVADVALRLLPSGTLTLELVGAELGIRPRTLQRKLHNQGTSLSMIIDDLRKAVASRLLRESDAKAWAIATELGFRDKTAFYRAFRRWTGSTPRKIHPLHDPARGTTETTPALP